MNPTSIPTSGLRKQNKFNQISLYLAWTFCARPNNSLGYLARIVASIQFPFQQTLTSSTHHCDKSFVVGHSSFNSPMPSSIKCKHFAFSTLLNTRPSAFRHFRHVLYLTLLIFASWIATFRFPPLDSMPFIIIRPSHLKIPGGPKKACAAIPRRAMRGRPQEV